jgi:hypothetical protein
MTADPGAAGGGAGAGRRAALGAAQADLLAALVAGGPVPPGWDGDRIGVQARALLVKRTAVAGAHHPWLVEALGEGEYARRFAEFAAGRPRAAGSGGHADAVAFEAHLRARRALPRRPGGGRLLNLLRRVLNAGR